MRRGVTVVGLVAGLVTLSLTGCGGVHTPSGVTVVRPVIADPGLVEPDIRKVAPGPAIDATPEQLVTGFLAAEASEDTEHAVAREFLAPGAVWNPAAGVSVYDPTTLAVRTTNAGRAVRVAADVTGMLGLDGGFAPAAGQLDDTYTVTKVNGQWRIAALPTGLRLTEADLNRTYRRATVWFLAPGRAALVAEPLLLAVPRPALPTALVRALLRGPADPLAEAVRTAVPTGLSLLGTAAVVDGVVGVDLSGAASGLGSATVRDLQAQLGATLAQLPTVTGIRITVNGRALQAGAPGVLTPAAAVAGYQFDGGHGELATYAVSGSGLIQANATPARADRPQAQQVPADAGPGGSLSDPAVAADSPRIAVLRDAPGGRALLTGRIHGSLSTRLAAGPYLSPSWGPGGELWVIRGGAQPTLLVLTGSGAPTPVALPVGLADGWGAAQLRAIRVARDGVRVVLVFDDGTRSGLMSAVIVRASGGISLAVLADLVPTLPLVAEVAWESSGRLALLGAGTRQAPLRPFEVAVDGSGLTQVSTVGLPSAADSLTAAPGLPLEVGAAGSVWVLTSGWSVLHTGRDPVYAG